MINTSALPPIPVDHGIVVTLWEDCAVVERTDPDGPLEASQARALAAALLRAADASDAALARWAERAAIDLAA